MGHRSRCLTHRPTLIVRQLFSVLLSFPCPSLPFSLSLNLSGTGGGIVGGGFPIAVTSSPSSQFSFSAKTQLLPSYQPIRYARAANGGINSSAYTNNNATFNTTLNANNTSVQSSVLDQFAPLAYDNGYSSDKQTTLPYLGSTTSRYLHGTGPIASIYSAPMSSTIPITYESRPMQYSSLPAANNLQLTQSLTTPRHPFASSAPQLAYRITTSPIEPYAHEIPPRPSSAQHGGRSHSVGSGQLPGYAGHIVSGAFRFGRSYGRITTDCMNEHPAGRRLNATGRF